MKKTTIILFLCVTSVSLCFGQTVSWKTIALEYLSKGLPEKAIPFYRQAVLSAPSDGLVRAEYAYSLQQAGHYTEALQEYTVAIGLARAPVSDIKYNMGILFSELEDLNSALQYYTDVTALDAQYSNAFLNKAIVEVLLQEYRAAEQSYTDYLVLEPESSKRPEIEEMLALLATYRDFPVNKVDKNKYIEKKELEELLNDSKERIQPIPHNQLLGTN